ncbi:MAG: DUF2461 domain-containing protein, partial [Terriglobia bacterium]
RGFTKETLEFLRLLKRNNRRPWFQKHKAIYDEKVRQPMVELVQAMNYELLDLAPELVTEPRKAIYRIYRDIRFSSDKSPYKTHVAALFSPHHLPKHAGAALYVHLDRDEFLVAGGVYMPGPKELWDIRNHVAQHLTAFKEILANRRFKKAFGTLEGEQLSRVPKGFPSDHPAAEFLRYKQFLISAVHPPEVALNSGLLELLRNYTQAMTPLIRFLNMPLTEERYRNPIEY